jgi:hypothetical protein
MFGGWSFLTMSCDIAGFIQYIQPTPTVWLDIFRNLLRTRSGLESPRAIIYCTDASL